MAIDENNVFRYSALLMLFFGLTCYQLGSTQSLSGLLDDLGKVISELLSVTGEFSFRYLETEKDFAQLRGSGEDTVRRLNAIVKDTSPHVDYGALADPDGSLPLFCNYEFAVEPEAVPWQYCSHVIINWAGLTPGSFQLSLPHVPKDGLIRLVRQRTRHPGLKVLIGVGGWEEGSSRFSAMVEKKSSRKAFLDGVLNFNKEYNLDGAVLYWHSPARRGGKHSDRQNYVHLLKEMQTAFIREGLSFSSTLVATTNEAAESYDLPQLGSLGEYFHVLAYDYNGYWNRRLGLATPLFPSKPGAQSVYTTLQYYMNGGIPREKIILTIPFYCRTFLTEGDPTLGAQSKANSYNSPMSNAEGFARQPEVCAEVKNNAWNAVWVPSQRGIYWTNGDKWATCENPTSVAYKIQYLQQLNIAGASAMTVDHDDAEGVCGEKFPLLKALYHYLRIF